MVKRESVLEDLDKGQVTGTGGITGDLDACLCCLV